MDEYVADELADGSDDEKRMEKAEKAAERKAAKRRLIERTEPPSRFGKGRPGPPSAAPVPVGGPSPQMTAALRRPGPVPVGPYFACGEVGHLRSYCPKITAAARKWYPFEQVPHVTGTAVVAGDGAGHDFGQGECGMVPVGLERWWDVGRRGCYRA